MGKILVGKYSRKIIKLERSFLVGKIPFKLEKNRMKLKTKVSWKNFDQV